ncbi:MAG: ATP-grasp domain-containing protein [Selenomonadaceae bacterium]|nr:ATP-grasp domain-containing protein [Selenomonadaceae bacterium]
MRIWFNHWFSTAYHLINLIRDGNRNKFDFIGSNKNDYAIYKLACDEWYREPEKISAEDYVDYCLNFCREHDINIFVPRRNLTAIAQRVTDFDNIGVKVLTGRDGDLMKTLDDKVATYEFISGGGLSEIIPPYFIAKTFDEFNTAYDKLKTADNRICYKLVEDEGAMTFRVIDDGIENISALYNMPNVKITRQAAQKILSNYDFKIPMIVMPYLSGREISVDCLCTPKGNIIIPRYKTNSRYAEIKFDDEIISVADKILSLMKLNVPVNIQFRLDGDKLRLLEINPRMSGGLQLSCLGAGINIPDLAINQLLGVAKDWRYPERKFCRVANIESPVVLNDA